MSNFDPEFDIEIFMVEDRVGIKTSSPILYFSPEDAETMVEALYDAAQDAKSNRELAEKSEVKR